MSSKYLISAVAVFIAIFLVIPYTAYAQTTTTATTTSSANPSTNPNSSSIACGRSPQQSPEGPIPPFCGRLIVSKKVDNSLGGTASPSDFTFSVTGNNPSLSTFQGSDSGTTIIIGPGSYQITEVSGPPGYSHKHHGNCETGTISAGQTIQCTIFNQFTPPTDTQPPQVLSFTVSPMRVSISSGGTVTISAHVTDQTGVERVVVFVQDQCGNGPGFFQSLQLPLVSGTPKDGTYEATFTFPQAAYDNVVQTCSPNGIDAYFEAGGLTSDTLGNQIGLPLIINIVLTK